MKKHFFSLIFAVMCFLTIRLTANAATFRLNLQSKDRTPDNVIMLSYKIDNITSQPVNVYTVVAQYDKNGKLIDSDARSNYLSPNQSNPFSMYVPIHKDSKTQKLFAFDKETTSIHTEILYGAAITPSNNSNSNNYIPDDTGVLIDTQFFPGWKRKAVTFSWDDNADNNLTVLEKVNNAGLKTTFHLIAGWSPVETQKESYIEKFKGHEISSHSYSHVWFKDYALSGAQKQITDAKSILSEYAGYNVTGFAWSYAMPTNATNYDYYKELHPWLQKESGVEYARTTIFTQSYDIPNDWYKWNTTCETKAYYLYLQPLIDLPDDGKLKLLSMYSHPADYGTDANPWSNLDDMLTTIKNSSDVLWNATYIDTCRYIKALDKLKISSNRITNPTNIDLYIKVNNEKVIIKAGETIYL